MEIVGPSTCDIRVSRISKIIKASGTEDPSQAKPKKT
jgi:hypothetical protein